MYPHDQKIADARAQISKASVGDLRRAQVAFATFHPGEERPLMYWAEKRPTYVLRWIQVGRLIRDDAE